MKMISTALKKTIAWRFDDLSFAEEGSLCSSLETQKRVVAELDRHGFKATFGLVTRQDGHTHTDNKPYFKFIKQLQKNGHEIAAHGVKHTSWVKYRSNKLPKIIKTMRGDFDDMGINPKIFIFPYLHTNWKAIPLLKRYGFDIIIKGERYMYRYIPHLIKSRYYSSRYSLDFFVPHSFSTEKSYHPPVLDLPKSINLGADVISHSNIIHVMDHIWLYAREDIKKFSNLLASTEGRFEWKTISDAVKRH